MKYIFIIRDGEEIITSRDTMNNAIAACMNRIAICGYLCEGFAYSEDVTLIDYRDIPEHATRTMVIERVHYKEGI